MRDNLCDLLGPLLVRRSVTRELILIDDQFRDDFSQDAAPLFRHILGMAELLQLGPLQVEAVVLGLDRHLRIDQRCRQFRQTPVQVRCARLLAERQQLIVHHVCDRQTG
jgi:hypothetical protein